MQMIEATEITDLNASCRKWLEMRAKQKTKVTFSLLDTQNREIGGCSAILCSENSAIC
jgi:hypothetical protein